MAIFNSYISLAEGSGYKLVKIVCFHGRSNGISNRMEIRMKHDGSQGVSEKLYNVVPPSDIGL